VKTMDEKNVPTAVLEFLTPAGSLGMWVASDWAGDPALVEAVRTATRRWAQAWRRKSPVSSSRRRRLWRTARVSRS